MALLSFLVIFADICLLTFSLAVFAYRSWQHDQSTPARVTPVFQTQSAPRSRRREALGILIGLLALYVFIAYFSDRLFYGAHSVLRGITWFWLSAFGGVVHYLSAMSLAWIVMCLYVVQAVLRPIAERRYPRINARVAAFISTVTLIIAYGYGVSSGLNLGVTGDVVLALGLLAAYLVYSSRAWLDIPKLVVLYVQQAAEFLLEGLIPALKRLLYEVWRIARKFLRVPRVFATWVDDAERRLADSRGTRGNAEQDADRRLDTAEEIEKKDDRGQ
jgi:hypothetical protein